MKLLSQTNSITSEKKPSYYIGEKIHKFYGSKLTELRIKNNVSRKKLSKSLNISLQTINSIESGMNNNPYYYYYIYCRHFSLDSNVVLDFSLIKTDTLLGKLEFLKATLGMKSLKELDLYLNLRAGSIYEYLSGRFKNKNIEKTILDKFNEIKNK